jgi:prevent-host-death family protein
VASARSKRQALAVLSQAQWAGSQRITKHGHPIAVILSQRDYERLTRRDGASIVDFFANSPLSQIDLTERDRSDVGREIELLAAFFLTRTSFSEPLKGARSNERVVAWA